MRARGVPGLAAFVIVSLLSGRARATADQSLVRVLSMAQRPAASGASSIVLQVENRVDADVRDLAFVFRAVRQVGLPVRRVVRPGVGLAAHEIKEITLDPALAFNEEELSEAAGVGVELATYDVTPTLRILDSMVRLGTDRDLRAALRSVGILTVPGAASEAVGSAELARFRDRLGEPPDEATIEDGLFGVVLARVLAERLDAGDVELLARWLADERWDLPSDTLTRALDRVEKAGVLGTVGPLGDRASAVAEALRRHPESVRTFFDIDARRSPEEQLVLSRIARAVLPIATLAKAPVVQLAELVPHVARLVPTDWSTGLLLTADRNGELDASRAVAAIPAELLLSWSTPASAWIEPQVTRALGARADGIPAEVRATLAKDRTDDLRAVVRKLELFEPTALRELLALWDGLRSEEAVPKAVLARTATRQWQSDPTADSTGWFTLRLLFLGWTPDSADAHAALDVLLASLANPDLDPERALDALDRLAAMIGEPRKAPLQKAYAAFVKVPDQRLAAYAKARAGDFGSTDEAEARPVRIPAAVVASVLVAVTVAVAWFVRKRRHA